MDMNPPKTKYDITFKNEETMPTVAIPVEEYRLLRRRNVYATCLENAGVRQWPGMRKALQEFDEAQTTTGLWPERAGNKGHEPVSDED